MPTSGWSNNVVTTGTPTFFTAPTGTNPSFVPASGDTMLTGKGATGNGVPSADIGLDPKCLVKRTPVMVGQVARVSTWQYDVDIDYIKSIGGVAKCFNPKARSGTPDIGAYRPGTVTAVTPGSCVAPPITGTGGSGGAGGSGRQRAEAAGAGGRGGAGGTGGTARHGRTAAARAAPPARDGPARTGAGAAGTGGGAAGTGGGPRAAARPEAEEAPRARAACGLRASAARARSAARGVLGGSTGSGGADRRSRRSAAPPEAAASTGGRAGGHRARARRPAAAATCLSRSTARERSRLSGSWRSAREPSGAGAARDVEEIRRGRNRRRSSIRRRVLRDATAKRPVNRLVLAQNDHHVLDSRQFPCAACTLSAMARIKGRVSSPARARAAKWMCTAR